MKDEERERVCVDLARCFRLAGTVQCVRMCFFTFVTLEFGDRFFNIY
jgi:hypothetical protein